MAQIKKSEVAEAIPFDNDTNGFIADNVQDAIEEVQNSSKGNLMDFVFVASGNTADKWLGIGNGSTASDTLPLVIPYDSTLNATAFTNQDNDVDINVKIYKNGSLVQTWQIRNKRTAWKTNYNGLTFMQGDRMSIFFEKYTGGTGDSTAQDPVLEVFLFTVNDNSGEGGTQNGV